MIGHLVKPPCRVFLKDTEFPGFPAKMAEWVAAVLIPSQDHINYNYRTTIMENHRKSCWTKALQLRTYRRSHLDPGRSGGDVKQADPNLRVWPLKMEGYLGCRGPPNPKEQMVPALHQAFQPRFPAPSGCENQRRLWLGEMESSYSPRCSS